MHSSDQDPSRIDGPEQRTPLSEEPGVSTRFFVGVAVLVVVALVGPGLSMRALVGFSEERQKWDIDLERRKELSADVEKLMRDRIQYESDAKQANEDRADAETEKAKAATDLNRVEHNRDRAEENESRAISETHRLTNDLARLREDTEEKIEARNELLRAINGYEAERTALRTNRDNEQLELDSLKRAITEGNETKEKLTGDIGKFQKESLQASEHRQDAVDDLAAARAVIEQAEKMKEPLKTLKSTFGRLSKEVEQLEEKKSKLQGLASEEADHRSEIARLRSEEKVLHIAWESLTKKVAELRSVAATLEREEAALRLSVESLKSDKQKFDLDSTEVAAAEKRRADLQSEISQHEYRKTELSTQTKTLDAQRQSLEVQVSALRANKDSRDARLNELRQTQASLETKVGALRSKLSEKNILEGELKELRSRRPRRQVMDDTAPTTAPDRSDEPVERSASEPAQTGGAVQ
jgi:chromosome segregation ATPase